MELTINKLKRKGLQRNIDNSFFGQTKMEYLGLGVTHDDVKPTNKNIEAIKIWSQLLTENKYDSL